MVQRKLFRPSFKVGVFAPASCNPRAPSEPRAANECILTIQSLPLDCARLASQVSSREALLRLARRFARPPQAEAAACKCTTGAAGDPVPGAAEPAGARGRGDNGGRAAGQACRLEARPESCAGGDRKHAHDPPHPGKTIFWLLSLHCTGRAPECVSPSSSSSGERRGARACRCAHFTCKLNTGEPSSATDHGHRLLSPTGFCPLYRLCGMTQQFGGPSSHSIARCGHRCRLPRRAGRRRTPPGSKRTWSISTLRTCASSSPPACPSAGSSSRCA